MMMQGAARYRRRYAIRLSLRQRSSSRPQSTESVGRRRGTVEEVRERSDDEAMTLYYTYIRTDVRTCIYTVSEGEVVHTHTHAHTRRRKRHRR